MALQWSPEQISGRLRLEGRLSHEWIYKHVWKGSRRNAAPAGTAARSAIRAPGGRRVARTYVRGRRSRGSGTGKATRAPVTGAPCCRWWTARSPCWPCAGRPGKRAKRCASAWGRTRSSCIRRTTARSSRSAGRLPGRASFFFAQPYRERGLNEHTNGLVRQYKATDFHKLDPAERVEDLLDNRPRKALDYRTPAEVFKRALTGDRPLSSVTRPGAVGVRAHGRRLPNNCAGAAASRAGSCSGIAGHGQTACRPGETGRRPGGGIFRRGGGVRPGYALPAANAPAAPAP